MKFFLLFILFSGLSFGQNPLSKAEKLIDNKEYSQAEQVLLSIVSQHPKDLKAVELLGDVYGLQKQWDLAIERYKILIETQDESANYHFKYGGAMGMKALSVNKFKALSLIGDVKSSFLKAAELDPKHIEVRWALVELYMKLPLVIGGSKSKALYYANELHQLSEVDGQLAKGLIYDLDGDYSKAEMHYLQAVKIGGSITCYNKLSQFYKAHKKPKEAIKVLVTAVSKHKLNSYHYQIGEIAAESNISLSEGETHLKSYIKNLTSKDSPSKAWAHYRLAQIYSHKGQKAEAQNQIDLAILQSPLTPEFVTERSKINKSL